MKILYFARIREMVGLGEEDAEIPQGVRTVQEMMAWLAARGGGYAAAFSGEKIPLAAVDREAKGLEASIVGAEEVAFFPPVTGG